MRLSCRFLITFVAVSAGTGLAQTGDGTNTKAPAAATGSVAATVNGVVIPQSEVQQAFNTFVQRRFGGQMPPGTDLATMRAQVMPNILEMLISNELMDQDVLRAKVTVSDAELLATVEELLSAHLMRTGQTRKQFAATLKERGGPALKKLLSERAADPELKQVVLHDRLLEKLNGTELSVTPAEVEAKYKADLSTVFTKPATVRASHILVRSSPQGPAPKRDEASKKAAAILADAKKPNADFAALARDRSEGPSAPKGGDLGFFPREGAMVEPFAAAAFALKVGEVSGIVETQFGFHIIKVTEKKDAYVISLANATAPITEQLKANKLGVIRTKHLERLRGEAKIVITGTGNAPKSP